MTPLAYVMLGILGGLFVTVPLGPVNVMILQRAFHYGFVSGALAGLGASLADVLFATLAAFSISTVRAFVEGNAQAIQLVGGSLVVAFGARILWRGATVKKPIAANGLSASVGFRSLGSTFALTITNPATIFGFVAYFGALGEWGPPQDDYLGTMQLLLGVLLGTLGWWCLLSALVTRLRVRFTETMLERVNLFAGTLLVVFGAVILGRLSVTYFKLI